MLKFLPRAAAYTQNVPSVHLPPIEAHAVVEGYPA
jgi:hypothetical protein